MAMIDLTEDEPGGSRECRSGTAAAARRDALDPAPAPAGTGEARPADVLPGVRAERLGA